MQLLFFTDPKPAAVSLMYIAFHRFRHQPHNVNMREELRRWGVNEGFLSFLFRDTVDTKDIEDVLPWLEWAYAKHKQDFLAKAA